MSIFHQACCTYDAVMPTMSYSLGDRDVPLAPVAHFVKQADVEIQITVNGQFYDAHARRAERVKNKDGSFEDADPKIIIPVTEQSLSRSGSGAEKMPHYLCDQLRFFDPNNTVSYNAYVSQLEGWAGYASQLADLQAILKYVRGGTILNDLAGRGLDKLSDKSMVCWTVVGGGGPCWVNKGLMDSLTEYHMHRLARDGREVGLCMISGEECLLADSHAKGVVSLYGNAKLIAMKSSAVNKFTCEGRFHSSEQALSVGYEASQKAHNALAWLVANHGVYCGGRVFLCWAPKGVEIPGFGIFGDDWLGGTSLGRTMVNYKKSLRDALFGWKSRVDVDESVVFAILDSPATGCLSILHYSEMSAGEYFDRMERWAETCAAGFRTPSLDSLAKYAYGVPRKGRYEIGEGQRCMYRDAVHRLAMCKLDGRPFPVDIMRRLVDHASNLLVCSASDSDSKKRTPSSREQLLRAACAAVRKYEYDVKKEVWDMQYDWTITDRNYLFGSLLAIADRVESAALYAKAKKKVGSAVSDGDVQAALQAQSFGRETAAMRFQRAFSQRPLDTWKIIDGALSVYWPQIPVGSRRYYRKCIDNVIGRLAFRDPAALNMPLEPVYLIGFHEMRQLLRCSHKHQDNDIDAIDEASVAAVDMGDESVALDDGEE